MRLLRRGALGARDALPSMRHVSRLRRTVHTACAIARAGRPAAACGLRKASILTLRLPPSHARRARRCSHTLISRQRTPDGHGRPRLSSSRRGRQGMSGARGARAHAATAGSQQPNAAPVQARATKKRARSNCHAPLRCVLRRPVYPVYPVGGRCWQPPSLHPVRPAAFWAPQAGAWLRWCHH